MKLSIAVLAALLCAPLPVRAADDSASAVAKLSTWFNNLKQGLQQSANSGRYSRRRSSAVAAVRGNKQEEVDPDRPEWKRSTRSEKAELRKEKNELAAAVDMIVAGKYEEGANAITAFETAHPKSPLLEDAKKAKENAALLAQLRGGPAKSEPAPAATPKEGTATTASTEMKDAPAAPSDAPAAAPAEVKQP